MKSKVIDLNSRCGKTKDNSNYKAALKNELTKAKIKYDKIYSIESSIDDLIGYDKKIYESKMGWGILGLSILYMYSIASLFGTYDSFFIIIIIILGEFFILGLPKIFYKIIKNFKLSKASSSLKPNKLNTLKSLVGEKEKIRKSIKNNNTLHAKYLDRYVLEESYREHFFHFMSKYLHLNKDFTLNNSAEYAAKKIKKLNFGFKPD